MVGGTPECFYKEMLRISKLGREFEKTPGQKSCSEFDCLHMLKFHDFVIQARTDEVSATFPRCLGFQEGKFEK